jgi:hypothetical protein
LQAIAAELRASAAVACFIFVFVLGLLITANNSSRKNRSWPLSGAQQTLDKARIIA